MLNSASIASYIYFDHQDSSTQSARNVLLCILKQLLSQLHYDTWPVGLSERLGGRCKGAPDIAELTSFVTQCCQKFDKVFLIFDAMDECADPGVRWKVLEFIGIIRIAVPGTKVFITSRPQMWSNGGLCSAKVIHVKAQQCDIEAYVRAKTEHTGYDPGLVDDIITKLVESSQGMSFPEGSVTNISGFSCQCYSYLMLCGNCVLGRFGKLWTPCHRA